MRRPPAQIACPTKGQLDQRLPARGFAKHRTKYNVGEHDVHDHVHETSKHARRVVHQCVMHIGTPIKKCTRLTTQFGHQVFVDVIWPMKIPNHHSPNGIKRNRKCNEDKRQPPNLDVVSQEYKHRDTHNHDKPNARCGAALGIIYGIWSRQSVFFGKNNFGLKRLCDQSCAVPVQQVNDAYAVDLNKIGN